MAKVNLTTIKNWFKTGLKPTQAQFWDTWDSFWHKDDAIPLNSIDGLQEVLNEKLDAELFSLDNEMSDTSLKGVQNKVIKEYVDSTLGGLDTKLIQKFTVSAVQDNTTPLTSAPNYKIGVEFNFEEDNTTAFLFNESYSEKLSAIKALIGEYELYLNIYNNRENLFYTTLVTSFDDVGSYIRANVKESISNVFLVDDLLEFNINFYKKGSNNLSDFIDDIGATDGILPLSVLIDTVNGDDITAELENFNKPFKTLEAVFSSLPPTTGETYTIYISGTTLPVLRRLQPRNINWVSYTSTVLDFSNIKEDDATTQATQVFTTNGSHTWTFENENVSLICSNATAIKLNGVALKGRMDTLSWDTPQYSYTGNLDLNVSDIYMKQLNFIGSGRLFHGTHGDIEVGTLRLYSDRQLSYQGSVNITIHNIIADNLSTSTNCNLSYTETGGSNPIINIGNVDINGILFTYGSVNNFNDSIFSDTSQLRVSNKVKGNITSNNYLGSGSNANDLVLDNFTGKLIGLKLSNGTPIVSNSSIETNGSLFEGSSSTTNNITINGLTSIIQKDLSANLFLTYSYGNLNYPNDMHLIINGSLKSNVKDYGYKVTYETPTATFKERLGEIVIRSKRDIINKVLDNSLTYIIDGTITLTAGEYIEVPAGGNLTINGYGLEASNVIKNVAGESIFKSPVGGSGGLQMDAIKFTMGTPTTSCFDLTDATGFNAVECVKVNFEGSGNIGTLNGYRQYLWTNIGLFGLSDGITLEGTSIGGFSSNSIIVRNLSGTTGTLFKKGTSFSMVSRFSSNANIDIPSGWSILDFEEANFVNPNSLQLQGMFVTRAGVSDENDALYFPNIDEESDKCDWKANEGIKNSAISFEKIKSPDGTVWKLEVDNAGAITTTAV